MTENDERPPGGGERDESRPGQSGGDERTEPFLDPRPDAGQPETPEPGRMRFQDETTAPREPTLAERRAREQAVKREREAEEQRLIDEEAARKKRKRILVGTGVTVGVVALIAVGYAVSQPDEEVVAHCTDPDGVIVDDSNCVTPATNSSSYNNGGGGYYGGGFFPIFIGGGGRQYHYNYGGSGDVGQRVSGGTTTVPPSNTSVRSGSSGRSISRGGLGVSSGSSSGSKGGSSGSSSGS